MYFFAYIVSKFKYMELKEWSKYWGVVSYLVCGLLVILPISYTYSVPTENSEGVWLKQTVYNTFVYTIGIGSWILLWIILPKVKNKIFKKIGSVVMILLYGFAVFIIAYGLLNVSQDFQFSIGAELILLACPLILIDAYGLWKN